MTTEVPDWSGARGDKWCAALDVLEPMLAPLDVPLVDALSLHAPCRIADVACGGGATTQSILQHAPARSVVHGFDISPTLVAEARARFPRIAFDVADIATWVPERPYDRLASRFGVMFFDDPARAFANLRRWLVEGGRFAFAVWGPVADNAWMTTVRDVVAEIVEVPSAEPDAPGPFRYGDVSGLVELLEGTGFRDLHVRDWSDTLAMGGGLPAADAARAALASLSTFADVLRDAEDRAAAHASLTARLLHHERDGAVRMNARVHIVSGANA